MRNAVNCTHISAVEEGGLSELKHRNQVARSGLLARIGHSSFADASVGMPDPRLVGEVEASDHDPTQTHAKEVAAKDVEEGVVPPTLPKVEGVVSEQDLEQLPQGGAHPEEVPVTNKDHLAPPAKEVSEGVDVENVGPDTLHD